MMCPPHRESLLSLSLSLFLSLVSSLWAAAGCTSTPRCTRRSLRNERVGILDVVESPLHRRHSYGVRYAPGGLVLAARQLGDVTRLRGGRVEAAVFVLDCKPVGHRVVCGGAFDGALGHRLR